MLKDSRELHSRGAGISAALIPNTGRQPSPFQTRFGAHETVEGEVAQPGEIFESWRRVVAQYDVWKATPQEARDPNLGEQLADMLYSRQWMQTH